MRKTREELIKTILKYRAKKYSLRTVGRIIHKSYEWVRILEEEGKKQLTKGNNGNISRT